ncbi:GGDEF domain-containing protein [Bifidobacterium catenulatum]|uniref:GGDEF domain-containing protein n=1 Tax=Bifidobacterium catenulatum TaxID=1686 RepID=UPI0034A0E26E
MDIRRRFLFLSFRGNAPLFRGIMTHARDRQVFDAGSVGGGWRIMTVRAMFHICMELWGIFICLICAGGIFIATPRKTKRTRIKILMQIACMLLLGADALSWYFHADAGETAYYMIRISNFSVFCINYIFMSFFATYVWLTVSKNQHRKPAALHTVYALSVIGILLLIITQFTGLFYYFDDHNLYHRGNFYLLSQAIAVLGIALCLFMLISYRKNLERITFFSMMSFFVLPVLATIYQALAYGFSLQCLAIAISTQIMFVMDTVEMNMRFYSQQAAYEKARYEAEHDGMTGLLNKKAGWKHMRKYFDRMDSHDEAMLMFVDIDDFKIINDTYGHTVGDFWIREVASQLRHIYRQDDIICRYGGDEFIVLIRNTASEQVLETTLGMFFQQLTRASEQRGQDVHCSVGVCRVAAIRISGNRDTSRNTDGENGEDTRGGVDFGQCVKQADLALYETKRFNKGTFNVYNYDRS